MIFNFEKKASFLICFILAGILISGIFVSIYREYSQENYAFNPPKSSKKVLSQSKFSRKTLKTVANPNPNATPQPSRLRPYRVTSTLDGKKAYVTLSGKEIQPGSEVVVLDVQKQTEIKRIQVGCFPYGLALHPSGRWLIVANRFSNFLSIIDTSIDKVISEISVPFYSEEIIFAPKGNRAYVSNFWKNQVLVIDLKVEKERLTGKMHLVSSKESFFGTYERQREKWFVCNNCGLHSEEDKVCRRCNHQMSSRLSEKKVYLRSGISTILRASCGTSECHLYSAGGYYAGPDKEKLFISTMAHVVPGDPKGSSLLRTVLSSIDGGWADKLDGRHHVGGVVFPNPQENPDFLKLSDWIANGSSGPGFSVGEKPRNLAITPDGERLYVANTGSLDISVIDLKSFRKIWRIFTRSPVNDLVWVKGHLVLSTLGVGSGHPKTHHAGRESTNRNDPEAEFTLFRNPLGEPLPLEKQRPLGPYDDVDGTAQEKFRDITNDVVWLDPFINSVASYEATPDFTRYTSDSFEALPGDKKGDVPKELMKVVGAFPEQIVQKGNRLYITMSGTFQVQEWIIDAKASPEKRLTPSRVFQTGFKPIGIAIADQMLVVANQLSDSITFINLKNETQTELKLKSSSPSFPATGFERGEFFVQTSVFSVDQDQSCVHCHYRDASDGKKWSVSQVMGQSRYGEERTGGSREVPDLRALIEKVPFFLEGTLSIDEPLTMMMEHNPLIDFQGKTPVGNFSNIFTTPEEVKLYKKSADAIVVATKRKIEQVKVEDLIKRREIHFQQISKKYLGKEYSFREFQKFIGLYQRDEPRLLPNPESPDDSMVKYGKLLFEDPSVGCSGCHPAPTFTDKTNVYNINKSFPPLVTPVARDNIHTLISADRIDYNNGFLRLWDQEDKGRIEVHEGFFVAPSLRGIWARPPRFLHHGHALSLREVLCTPNHVALRRFPYKRPDEMRMDWWEKGFNELNGTPDTHGTTSHLSVWDIECLIKFIKSIE